MVHEALKSGINYIDTAPWYGNGRSEQLLGKALKDVPRSALLHRYQSTTTWSLLRSVDIIVKETLPALLKVVQEGRARYIGITGYNVSLLKEVVEKSL
ncbi:hypothetical protein Pmani_035626 [Petrolisthes manimaculis]|uniref:NADP-dependent oxidoreductase domain-containing protein n=1 Tax=Petrolisthes manimaculis TaxID=1843537 RepID=A0AAE1NLD7_9EUCA|nr:hypothetical protein Pmani_035626 [Petrolisthes manimaculis]